MRAFLLSIGSLAVCALAGCTVGPNYHRPAAPAPPAFKEQQPPPNPPDGTWKQAQPEDAAHRGKWWEIYGDPQLNSLEEQVVVSNQTLRAATERYLAAQEQVRVARADAYPALSVGADAQRLHPSQRRAVYVPGSKTNYGDLVLQGQATWEPDLWGRVRRSVEAAKANAQASAADLAGVELSLRSELALDYFQLRGLDLQKQLLDSTVADYEGSLELTQRRFHGGVASDSDVAQAETQLRSTRSQAIDVGVARAQFEHAIATLVGVPASSFSLAAAPLNLPLPAVPAGLPSQLLERRPDVAAAERRVQAANAQIGLAISAYYPNITLGGNGGFESGGISTLIQGPGALWSLGASASELLFDAGRRHALTQQSRDLYEATASDYRESVLNSFQEVEDSLAALRLLDEESRSERDAVTSAERSLTISNNRYTGGVTGYLEVLTAQTAKLTNQRSAADITTRQFAASVRLIRAIGGGWDASQLPRP
ncbi:MAG TPA: efflux transporter outer membrane subunit [Acidisarcina sp.]|nr:efflux transporter outer membrane subunit [Acidisarcina sp.]